MASPLPPQLLTATQDPAVAPSQSFVIPLPPPGTNYLLAIEPSLNLSTISTIASSMLIPCLCALFMFSTSRLRRSPIFILNVSSVLLGIVLGVINLVVQYQLILLPSTPIPLRLFLAYTIMSTVAVLLVETILVLRLLAVFPILRGTICRSIAIFGPLAVIKVVRMTLLAIYYRDFVVALQRNGGQPLLAGQATWATPASKAQWTLQVVDNIFTSGMFVWKLRNAQKRSRVADVYVTSVEPRPSGSRTFKQRLATLFWIAASNFVFPTILSIVQLMYLVVHEDFLTGSYVFIVNIYIQIIGVLFATVWVAGSVRQAEGTSYSVVSDLRFGDGTTISHFRNVQSDPGRRPSHFGDSTHTGIEMDIRADSKFPPTMGERTVKLPPDELGMSGVRITTTKTTSSSPEDA